MDTRKEATLSAHLWTCCSYCRVVSINNHNVTSLAFGRDHCLFITSDNRVYSFGQNNYGQLGTGNNDPHLKEPYHIESLPSNICSIACGSFTSAALTSDGNVFMWGHNDSLQCGVPGPDMLVPTSVPFPSCKHQKSPSKKKNRISQISCGDKHSLAIANQGLWIWGNELEPTLVKVFENRKVLSVACGEDYSLVVVAAPRSVEIEDGNNICNECDKETEEFKCPLGLVVEGDIKADISVLCTTQGLVNSTQLVVEGEVKEDISAMSSTQALVDSTSVVEELLDTDKKMFQESLLEDISALSTRVLVDSTSGIEEMLDMSNKVFQDNSTSTPVEVTQFELPDHADNPLIEANACQVNSDTNDFVELREHSPARRTGSLIDPQNAKQYLDKLTDDPQDQSFSPVEGNMNQSSEDSRITFVWDMVSKMKSSFNKFQLPMTNINKNTRTLSQESFEVVETNLVDTDTGSADDSASFYTEPFKRSGSLKSLLELKQDQRPKEHCRKTSIEALVTMGRKRSKKLRIEGKKTNDNERVCIQTEVWSWGNGTNGQLGHNDQRDRNTPTCIKQLSGQGVVRVLAGRSHSIALTADSRVFTFGCNEKGQLGHSFAQQFSLVPKVIELPHNELIWDVATGDTHTLLLVDHKAPHVAIYYCGSHDANSEKDQTCICPKEKAIHQLNILKKSGLITRVFGGGPYCGCIVNHQGLSELPVRHEFAATERKFLFQLQVLLLKLFRPLMQDGPINCLPDLFAEPLQKIIAKLATIADMVALNSYDLTIMVLTKGHLDGVYIADIPDDWLETFLTYTQLLCDVISVNAAAELTKEWSWTPSRLKMLARDILPELGMDKKSSAEILIYLFSTPIRRAKDYARLFKKVGSSNLMCVQEVNIQDLTAKWQQLVDNISADVQNAELTRKFWDSAPNKIVENFRRASLRLVRDSKIHPIQLQSSGRFSTHWFLLFSEVLLHHHFGSTHCYPLQTIWVEPLPDTENCSNSFLLRMPEDVFTLVCTSPTEKTEWICAFNYTIRHLLDFEKDPLSRVRSLNGPEMNQRLSPPLPRQAKYTFSKTIPFKEATYNGMWLCGKVHGQGEMLWSDGRKYIGKFKQNVLQGEGVMTLLSSGDRECTLEGVWKDGKLNGRGCIRYPNGDVYEGYFKDDQKHGHGMLKQGQFLMSAASVYIGQWYHDQRHGYGVLDDIRIGEKYMGMWQEDARHGKGLVVTIDGIYYEGTFVNDKLQGFGALMFEDGTFFEGELGQWGTLNGKGTLYLSNGDRIDGAFNGVWSDGVKISGVYNKSTSISSPIDLKTAETNKQKWSYGDLCVPAYSKWNEIFLLCKESLGIVEPNPNGSAYDNKKAWDAVAVAVAKHKKEIRLRRRYHHYQVENVDLLERIPHTGSAKGHLTLTEYQEMQQYLTRACDCPFHPLGQLIENIVDVYRAAYLGVGAHPRLLPHAVAEVHMFIAQTYEIVRIFFPDLPLESDHYTVRSNSSASSNSNTDECDYDFEDNDREVVSAAALLDPLLLPRLYPPLFTLYALHNEKEDDQYWKRLLKWNRQSDIALLAFLGVNQRFWSMRVTPEMLTDKTKSLSSIKEIVFAPAVEMLQHISTEFTPQAKLKTIHQAFKSINEEVRLTLPDPSEDEFLWTMDELFPVFQYVVVRARIRHLGSEIHLIDDLMEKHFQMGELGIMFTTLKACYFQIRTEKAQQ